MGENPEFVFKSGALVIENIDRSIVQTWLNSPPAQIGPHKKSLRIATLESNGDSLNLA